MKEFLISLMSLISIYSFSQITFDKAYFIDNNGIKTECLIQNKDWKFNPESFEFKLSGDDMSKSLDISSVKEFGIIENSKFIRANVNIDRSKADRTDLSRIKEPEWSNEQVFLKVLIEGNVVLYSFKDQYNTRFFYSIEGSPAEQFIYKEYVADDGYVKKNNLFQRQLWMNFRCENISQKDVENVFCSQDKLEKYFRKYFECKGTPYVDYKKLVDRDKFNIRFKSGIVHSSFDMKYSWVEFDGTKYVRKYLAVDFGSQTNFSLGMEFEYMMPFRKNKWALFVDPNFQYFKTTSVQINGLLSTFEIKYIESPIGIRHYFFLNENLKFNLSGLLVPNLYTDHNLSGFLSDAFIKPIPHLAAGVGLNYKKFSAEFRFYRKYSYSDEEAPDNVLYPRISFMIGFQLY